MRDRKFTLYFTSDILAIEEVAEIPPNFNQALRNAVNLTTPFNLHSNLNANSPIIDAKICRLVKADSCSMVSGPRFKPDEKPVYLKAEIEGHHLDTGESTNDSQSTRTLASIIRGRGKTGDDCGHIIAKQLGGKMVHFNLFPQDSYINRGRNPWNRIWRMGIEMLIKFWLNVQVMFNPMVRFQVILCYDDIEHPDRPSNLLLCLEFYKRGDDSSDSDEESEGEIKTSVSNITLAGDISNERVNITEEEAKVYSEDIITFRDLIQKLKLDCKNIELEEFIDVFIETLNGILAEWEEFEEVNVPSTLDETRESSSSFSIWDYVPIVGSIRTIGDAMDEAKKGNTTGFWVNYTLGVGGLVLDVCSLGAAGLAFKVACKTAVTHGVKDVTKAVIKGAAKHAARQAAINAGIGAAVGGALGGKDGAGKGALRGALGGAIGGGLFGGSRGATKESAKFIAAEAAKVGAEAAIEAAKIGGKEAAKHVANQVAKDVAKQASKGFAAEALRDVLIKEAANRAAASCGPKIAVE